MKPASIVRRFARVAGLLSRRQPLVWSAHEIFPDLTSHSIQRILYVRLDHIGDVALSIPALAALRAAHPQARIDVVVRPAIAPLLQDLVGEAWPGINRVLTYDSPRFPQRRRFWSRGAGIRRTLQFARQLARENYDIGIDGRGDDIARVLLNLAKLPIRLGPNRVYYEAPDGPNLAFLMTHVMRLPIAPEHAVVLNRLLLAPLGVDTVKHPQFHWPISKWHSESVSQRLGAHGLTSEAPFVVIHTRTNDVQRDWDAEYFAKVAAFVVERYGLSVLLSGATVDAEYNEKLCSCLSPAVQRQVVNVAGVFSLPELPAFLKRARLLITVDTGPMHIAAIVGTPVVALMLPFIAPRYYPWNQCEAVLTPGEGRPLTDITPEQVCTLVEQRLREFN